MNVYETKQIYNSIPYKIIGITITRDVVRYDVFSKISTNDVALCLFFSDQSHECSPAPFESEKKCKNTCDIYLELRLHSLYGCQGLLNSHLSKKAKRDTIQMAKMSRIAQLLPPIRDRVLKKMLCLQDSYMFIHNFLTASF